MRTTRPNNQLGLFEKEDQAAFTAEATGEVRSDGGQGVEARMVKETTEGPAPKSMSEGWCGLHQCGA